MAKRGGKRAGAGRKSDAQLVEAHTLMDIAVTSKDWDAIFKRMVAIVKTSDNHRAAVAAAEYLHRSRWGLPTQYIAAPDGKQAAIQIIEVVAPKAAG